VRVTLALRPILIKWPSAESVKGARATGIKFYTRAGIPGRAAGRYTSYSTGDQLFAHLINY
jgi:hypothetical protein